MRQAKEVVDSFFEIPVSISVDFVRNLAEGFEQIVREYIAFIISCGKLKISIHNQTEFKNPKKKKKNSF